MLLLNKCFDIKQTASAVIISSIALKPAGVLDTLSMKIPTASPVSAAVSSEENIQHATKSASGSIGFAVSMFILKTPTVQQSTMSNAMMRK